MLLTIEVRGDTERELTDVLVYTDQVMLFIQAKDSPNTEAALRRSVERKQSATRAHIEKASKQLRGAINYAERNGAVFICTADGTVTLPIGGRQLFGLVVVREMFDNDYAACSAPVLKAARSLRHPAVLLDYSGLHIMARNLHSSACFINGLHQMFAVAIEREEFPKPAWFGPPPRE